MLAPKLRRKGGQRGSYQWRTKCVLGEEEDAGLPCKLSFINNRQSNLMEIVVWFIQYLKKNLKMNHVCLSVGVIRGNRYL